MQRDRDHDGIPDEYDLQPDRPAKTRGQRWMQDRREAMAWYYEQRKRRLEAQQRMTKWWQRARTKISIKHTTETTPPTEGFLGVIPSVLFLLVALPVFYLLFGLSVVGILFIASIIFLASEGITSAKSEKPILYPGIIGIAIILATIGLSGLIFIVLMLPAVVMYLGYMLQFYQRKSTDNAYDKIIVLSSLFFGIVTGIVAWYVVGVNVFALSAMGIALTLGLVAVGSLFHAGEMWFLRESDGGSLILCLIGSGIYAGFYVYLLLAVTASGALVSLATSRVIIAGVALVLIATIIEDLAAIKE